MRAIVAVIWVPLLIIFSTLVLGFGFRLIGV